MMFVQRYAHGIVFVYFHIVRLEQKTMCIYIQMLVQKI